MRAGIGLPGTIPGVKGEAIVAWAERAESGPFASLGTLDRIAYTNYDPLVTLAAAAAVTHRVRLMTTILIATARNTTLLAKEVASLDGLSNGRLTLGLSVGGREDDFQVSETDFHSRGKRFDEQLEGLHRIWTGQPPMEGIKPIGPLPVQQGGPPLLIGGYTPAALKRLGKWGVGYISGGGGPDRAAQGYAMAEQTWRAAGRPGKPLFVGATYFALGPNAAERGAVYIRDYYSFASRLADGLVHDMPATPDAVRARIQAFADAGCDELILWPTIADVDQVDRLAELVR